MNFLAFYVTSAVSLGLLAPGCFMAAEEYTLPTLWNEAAFVAGALCLSIALALACWWPDVQEWAAKKDRERF